jgi:hypothetical protein
VVGDGETIRLPLERYAELMAHLVHFAGVDPHELRELLSIAPEAFDDATARWPLRLRDDQLEGDGALTARFGQSFALATKALKDAATTIAQLRERRGGATAPRPTVPRPTAGSIDETVHGAVDLGAVMPFVAAQPQPPPPEPPPPEPADPPAHEASAADALGSTAMMPPILLDRDATLPFVEATGLDLEDSVRNSLSLEQYASLRAELALQRSDRPSILTRYGIADESAHGLLVAAWDKHLAADADARSKLERLTHQFTAWLRQQEH